MTAYQEGKLRVRLNLHLGVGLLAATSAIKEPGRLRFDSVSTRIGEISYIEAGNGPPLLALHGLGGTKASFLPTIAALADSHRVVALDLPGFGESAKPIAAPYDARWMARTVIAVMDRLEIERAHLVGNSMGGRVALEAGINHPDRIERLVLLCPAVAWLRDRRWAGALRLLRPELGLLQVAPRPVVERVVRGLVPGATDGWAAAGVDEFLRSYLTPRGRAAFYAAARNIYLDEPDGEEGFWTRLSTLERDCLFVWGEKDGLVPVGFRRHVEEWLPRAEHLVLPCGHVPQVELPAQTHHAMLKFLAMSAPSYRERLALEGSVLAGSGAIGSAALLALADGATDGPWNTIGQLAVVAVLCAWLGPLLRAEMDGRGRAGGGRRGERRPDAAVAAAGHHRRPDACGGGADRHVGRGPAGYRRLRAGRADAGRADGAARGARGAPQRPAVRAPAGSRIGRGTRLGWTA